MRRGGRLWHSQTIAYGAGRERQTRYQQYVEEAIREGIQTSPWEHVQAQLVLGGCEFLEKIRRKGGGGGIGEQRHGGPRRGGGGGKGGWTEAQGCGARKGKGAGSG